MEYPGKVIDGVIVLDNGQKLAEGTAVKVQPVDEPPTWGEVFKDVIGQATDLPSDMARNHDHYLHGAPAPC